MKLLKWQWAGFLFTGILGILLHFAFDWSDQSPLVAAFSGVNESTWEHMKLLFFPLFLFAGIEGRALKEDYPEFQCVKLWGTLAGILTIPVVFYTFNGAFGPSPDWFNIAIFYMAAAVTFLLETALFHRGIPCRNSKAARIALWAIAVAFVLFTWRAPEIPLFRDPLTGAYGI